MVTAKEIAEAAHVSRSTVQRALGEDHRISLRTKSRILKIAEAMGYRPNRHAQALVMRKQNLEYSVILTIAENKFMQEVLRGINKAQDELKDSGVKVSIHFMDEIDGPQQAKLIDQLVTESKKGIVLVPIDCKEVRQAIERGSRKGTAFVTITSDIKTSRRLCFVGQDNLQSGRVAGGIMSLVLQRGDKIACIIGSTQFPGHMARLNGFRQRYLESHDEKDIVSVLENFDSARLSKSLTRELLKQHSDLRGIFVGGAGVEGICHTLVSMGLGGKIRIVTFDLVQSRRFCKEGIIDFVIDQDPVQEGYRALAVLNSFVMYKEVPPTNHFTKIDIRTRETVDLYGEDDRT